MWPQSLPSSCENPHADSLRQIHVPSSCCTHHTPAVEAVVDARRCAPPPPQAAQSNTDTYAAASGTIPLRLCVRRGVRQSPTKGARRPKPRRGLRGRGCPQWGNPACSAFARATPTALVAKRSAGVIPCGPAPRSPAYTKDDAHTQSVHEGRHAHTGIIQRSVIVARAPIPRCQSKLTSAGRIMASGGTLRPSEC
jgi:hypothetical protein